MLFDEISNIDDYYKNLHNSICGIDEVGRGPLCGPVVAACISPKKCLSIQDFPSSITDSKKLNERTRESLSIELHNICDIGIGVVPNDLIDNLNILQATMLAMHIAYNEHHRAKLSNGDNSHPFALIDGNKCPQTLSNKSIAVVKGDQKSKLIGAASIIAKVHRDNIMKFYDREHPAYLLKSNKGYGTAPHRKAILENGPSVIHRLSFLKKMLN